MEEVENNVDLRTRIEINPKPNPNPRVRIKHLVMSGGSVWGFSAFGVLFQAISSGFLNMEDIKSIYCTSVGSIICMMLALKIDHTILKEYLIQRPWESVCKKNRCSVLEIFDNKGIIQTSFIENVFLPLLNSIDLDISSTMLDIYNYNGIDIHIYTTELNKYELIDISYKTHPDWRIIDAIHSSCCVPVLFSPIIKDNCCYIDGGFLLNYPISKCIEQIDNENENRDEILGISLGNTTANISTDQLIKEESNVFDLLNLVIHKALQTTHIFKNEKCYEIPYQIHLETEPVTLDYGFSVLYNKEDRKRLIASGINTMNYYLEKWNI